jgi:hypothetical protein
MMEVWLGKLGSGLGWASGRCAPALSSQLPPGGVQPPHSGGSEGGDYPPVYTRGDKVRSARASVNTLHLKLGSFQGSVVRCAR